MTVLRYEGGEMKFVLDVKQKMINKIYDDVVVKIILMITVSRYEGGVSSTW